MGSPPFPGGFEEFSKPARKKTAGIIPVFKFEGNKIQEVFK
jgi:hypothetical protein